MDETKSAFKPYSDAAPQFEILHRDENFVAIEKPPGFHVHQPEDPRRRVSRDLICMNNLRNQIEKYVYPVHRIDVGTDGVLLFALNKETASHLSRQFQDGLVRKTYFAIVRGWADDEGVIDIPLELDSTDVPVPSLTRFRTHARVELPFAVGKRHASARYSLVEAHPETGRFHQVRRHLARLSHPLVGDRVHGDSHHNRFFREELGFPGLWLKAKAADFVHPATGARIRIESKWSERWLNIFAKLGIDAPT
ncbi:MAG TPA: pseudouridine synthase [Bdellovibrionales bacterium]|nr:pseudouridine synthase [Bdellovibrionales bacterium]